MAKAYNIITGLIFSIAIAILAATPRIIRLDVIQLNLVAKTILYISVSLFSNWMIAHYFLLKQFRLQVLNSIYVKASISILAGIIIVVLISYLYKDRGWLPLLNTGNLRTGFQVFLTYFFRAVIISGFTYFVVYYLRLSQTLQNSRLENEFLKQENLKASLATLKQQISPHFLFNSLNTISSLTKDVHAKEYIVKLSDVYRYVLLFQEQNEVLVKNELDFIHSYLYVMESRFENALNVSILVSSENRNRKIIPLALQLLVENAIKHNIVSSSKPLTIKIYDDEEGLTVENNFQIKNIFEASSGFGLNNLAQRYRLSSGQNIKVEQSKSCFKVTIPFLS